MTKAIFLALFCAATALTAADSKIQVVDPDAETGSARAVIVEEQPMAYTTQVLPLNPKGEVIGGDKIDRQLGAALSLVGNALHDGGSDLQHAVKLNVYAANDEAVGAAQRFFSKVLRGIASPAVTYVVGKLPHTNVLVAIDAIGTVSRPETNVRRERSKNVPGDDAFADVAVLPVGGVAYISGQAEKGPLADATFKTLEKLEATLKYLKLEKKDIVSAKAFVMPATDSVVVRGAFARFFKGELVPPLSIVDWTSGKDLPIEIEIVAAAKGTGAIASDRISYLCPPFMTNSPVYSKITRINSGKVIYLSGLTGKSANNAEAEVHEIFAEMKEVLNKCGGDLDHLAKATYYVSNPQTSGKLNEIRPKYYNPKTPPAASKAMVKSVGFAGKGVTFDMIAVPAQ